MKGNDNKIKSRFAVINLVDGGKMMIKKEKIRNEKIRKRENKENGREEGESGRKYRKSASKKKGRK